MDEQYRKRVDERAMDLIRSGEYDNLVIPDRGARVGRNNQDDRSLSYSIRDIPTFDGNGDSLPHIHILEFSDFLDNTGSEFRDLPQEPQADDREYHMTVIKDVVSNFKVSLKGKPRLWFEMQYPTSADEPKTKEAYEKMVASFISQTQVQKMIDIGLEVGIVLEVDLEVEEGLSRTVLTAINQIMIGLIVIDIPKT